MPAGQVAPAGLIAGKAVGRIVNLPADGPGHTRAVVVDAGCFMGNRTVVLAWSAPRFVMGDNGPEISTAIRHPPDPIQNWRIRIRAGFIAGRPIAIRSFR